MFDLVAEAGVGKACTIHTAVCLKILRPGNSLLSHKRQFLPRLWSVPGLAIQSKIGGGKDTLHKSS